MKIFQDEHFAVIETKKEFVLVLNEEMAGPFPKSKEMFRLVIKLMEDPDNKNAKEACARLVKQHRKNK